MVGDDVPSSCTFQLTRNAALELRRIHTRSRREWGEVVADQYLADLYAVMGMAAATERSAASRLGWYLTPQGRYRLWVGVPSSKGDTGF
jgi:toxin ParE1/3/4